MENYSGGGREGDYSAGSEEDALYPSAPQQGAGRASALQDSYREGEPLLEKCLTSCCSTEMGFTQKGAALAGGACPWPAAGEPPLPPGNGEVSPAPGSAQLQAPSADAQSHYSPPADWARPVQPSMASSSLQGSRESLFFPTGGNQEALGSLEIWP